MSTEPESTSATDSGNNADRRDYFRIHDTIALRVVPVASAALPVTPPGELAAGHQLLRELQLVDTDSAALLRIIQDKSRDIGQYLKLINRKLDLIARFYVLQQASSHYQPHDVILSGSGIGFAHTEALPVGSLVDLHFILLHTATAVSCRAQIARCDQTDGRFYLGSEFTDISDSDRDAIVRHTLHVEAARRREARTDVDDSDI